MSLEKITVQQMDAKGVCSAPDVLSGTPAQNKAVFDRMMRELFAPAYNAAVDAINAINQTESGIEAAEALRVSAENLRVQAETARIQAESGRVTAEQARVNAENLRVEAENLRQAAETARAQTESGRATAEQARESAEATRVANENQRIANENARIAAEQARVSETTGVVAQAAEQAEAAAESARLAAQAMLGQIPDGSFPESKLVAELQAAIDRAKAGGEIDITLANKLGGIESADYPGCYYRTVDGVVEWFNPPLLLGVEYRTTERYHGKPVYAKALDCGIIPSGTKDIDHGISNMACCFAAEGNLDDINISGFAGSNLMAIFCMQSKLRITSTADLTGYTNGLRVKLKYTKSTD